MDSAEEWRSLTQQGAAISGISARTLHFYGEMGLLAPAYDGANGYLVRRGAVDRELHFELKQVQRILREDDVDWIDRSCRLEVQSGDTAPLGPRSFRHGCPYARR